MGVDPPAKARAVDGNAAIVWRSFNQSSGWPRHHKSIGQRPQVKQESGDQSVNLQAGGDIVVGVTYDDARQIALDVYKVNALELAAEAKKAAIARAEEITTILGRTKDKNPSAFLKQPDRIFRLHSSKHKGYVKTGDKSWQRYLSIFWLMYKAGARKLREIVLAESLQVVPRLTMRNSYYFSDLRASPYGESGS